MVKEGYKETELGVIPQDWGVFAVADIIDVLTDFTANGSFASLADNVTYHEYPDYARLVRLTDIRANFKNEGIYVSKSSYDFLKKSSLFGGELLLANVGAYAGYSFLFKKNFTSYATLGPNMFLIKTNKNILSEAYTALVFGYGTVFKQLIDKAASSAQPKINKANVRECLAIIPPLVEQEKIAETVSDMDNLISSLEKLIEKKKAIKEACLQKMFPKEGETVPEMRLPGFTDPWEQRKLKDFGKATGGTSIESEFSDDGKYKVISIGSYSEDSVYRDQGIRAIESEKTKNRVLNEGDLTMILNDKTASGNIIGRVLLIEKSGVYVYNQRTERIEIDHEKFDSLFIYEMLNAPNVRDKIIKQSQGNTQIYVNWPTIAETDYLVPKIEEQRYLGKFFYNLDNLITLHQRKLEKCKKIKQGMMQQLLTGRIRLI